MRPTLRSALLYLPAPVAATLVLSAAACYGAQQDNAGDRPVDAIFLIDSSSSISRDDPAGMRMAIVEAFASFLWERPGDRVAIAQFGGWEETLSRGAVLVKLREIPSDPAKRKELVDELAARLEGMSVFGQGTDPNAALRLALGQVIGDRGEGDQNVLWAVVLTDGDVNVVEGDVVRKEYVDKAEQVFGRAHPDTLTRMAWAMFVGETVPNLKEFGVIVQPAGIDVSAEEPGVFFKTLSQDFGTELLRVGDRFTSDLMGALMKSFPGRRGARVFQSGAGRTTLQAGGQIDVPWRVLPGAGKTRAFVVGSSAEFGASFENVNAVDGFNPASAAVLGEGKAFRVVCVEGAPPGNYALRLRSLSVASPVDLDVQLRAEADVQIQVEIPEEKRAAILGTPFDVDVSVLTGKGKPVTEASTLGELRVHYAMVDEDGNAAEDRIPLADAVDGRKVLSLPLDGFRTGKCMLTASLEAYATDESTCLYTGEPYEFEFVVAPGVRARFETPKAFIGQEVALTAVLGGKVDVVPPELAVAMQPEKTATVTFDASKDRYEGTTAFNEPGTWSIVRGGDASFAILAGAARKIEVAARNIRVLSKERAELDSIEIPGRFCEQATADPGTTSPYERVVIVEVDVAKGETPAIGVEGFAPSALFTRDEPLVDLLEVMGKRIVRMDTPGNDAPLIELLEELAAKAAGGMASVADVSFSIREVTEPEPGTGVVNTGIALSVKSDAPLPRNLGTINVTATFGAAKATRTVPVSVAFGDYWQKLAMRTLQYWVPAAVLLLLFLRWLMLARFKKEEVRPIAPTDATTAEAYRLRTLGRRKAKGFPEVPKSVLLRMKGNKLFGRRVLARAMGVGSTLTVNGSPCQGVCRLRHADELDVDSSGGTSCRYWFFEREPTEEELAELRSGDRIRLAPDELVIIWD